MPKLFFMKIGKCQESPRFVNPVVIEACLYWVEFSNKWKL